MFLWGKAKLNYSHTVQKLIRFIFLKGENFPLTKIMNFLHLIQVTFKLHADLSY